MLKHSTPNSKHYAQGATLIEVLVSVFLMTFGVLGLMAAQIRSVAAISEAENRTIVAQAADNLSDSMQMNPEIYKIGSGSTLRIVRRYANYAKNTVTTVAMDGSKALPNPLWGNNWASTSASEKANITKAQLATDQLNHFEYALSQVPNATSMQYVICLDKANPADPTFNQDTGAITNANCSPSSSSAAVNQTVIKVVWAVRADREDAKAAIYTYQLRVPD